MRRRRREEENTAALARIYGRNRIFGYACRNRNFGPDIFAILEKKKKKNQRFFFFYFFVEYYI